MAAARPPAGASTRRGDPRSLGLGGDAHDVSRTRSGMDPTVERRGPATGPPRGPATGPGAGGTGDGARSRGGAFWGDAARYRGHHRARGGPGDVACAAAAGDYLPHARRV